MLGKLICGARDVRQSKSGDVMAKLSEEIAAYETMRAELEADCFGKWVVFHDEQLVGTYPEFEAAANEAVRRFGRGPYLIRRVGEPPLNLPASVLYRA